MKGTEIRAIRTRLGINQTQFAAALGVAPSSVYRWEEAGNANKEVKLEHMQLALLLKTQEELENRKASESKTIGEDIGKALLVGGTLYAAYKLLEALFGKK